MKTLDEYMGTQSDKFSYLNQFKKNEEPAKETKNQ